MNRRRAGYLTKRKAGARMHHIKSAIDKRRHFCYKVVSTREDEVLTKIELTAMVCILVFYSENSESTLVRKGGSYVSNTGI